MLLVARVEAGGVQPELEPPLMYYRRSWGVWSPAHDANEADQMSIPAIEVSGRDLRWQGLSTELARQAGFGGAESCG